MATRQEGLRDRVGDETENAAGTKPEDGSGDIRRKRLLRMLKRDPAEAIERNMPEMIAAVMELGKTGSVQHVKLTLELLEMLSKKDKKTRQEALRLHELLLQKLEGREVSHKIPAASKRKAGKKAL